MKFHQIAAMGLAVLGLGASAASAQIWHRETIQNIRVASLAYDAEVCGVWIANEGPDLILMSTFGVERLRFDSGMRSVRSLTVEGGGLLIADGWGDFRRIDRTGRPIDAPFTLSETLVDTEGLHRDADGSFWWSRMIHRACCALHQGARS